MNSEKNKRLEEAVRLTWRIALAHGCPGLTLEQLMERLVTTDIFKKQDIKQVCKKLGLKLISRDEYKNKYEKKIEQRIRRLDKVWDFWKKIAWIKMVAITGSVSGGYPEKDEDTDIMLISEDNRLWLCRLISYFWLKKNRVEIKQEKMENTNSLCLNLWLEERSLKIEESKQNLGVAQDAIMCKTLLDKDDFKIKMLLENSWIKKYLATGYNMLTKNNTLKTKSKKTPLDFWTGLNWLCYLVQKIYMSKKIGKEVVKIDRAYFHPYG